MVYNAYIIRLDFFIGALQKEMLEVEVRMYNCVMGVISYLYVLELLVLC